MGNRNTSAGHGALNISNPHISTNKRVIIIRILIKQIFTIISFIKRNLEDLLV
jgi:hypothetical protein